MTTTTTDSRNEAALARAVERWNAGDLSAYLEVYADDIRLHGVTPEPMDKQAVRASTRGSSRRSRRTTWSSTTPSVPATGSAAASR